MSGSVTRQSVRDERMDASHEFLETEKDCLRRQLLNWYDQNKKELPWRVAEFSSETQKAYSVTISSFLVAQHNPEDAAKNYTKWMKAWPTVADLAEASVDEVNAMWADLGLYSRGRCLLEIAHRVMEENFGKFPAHEEKLMGLPNVGRYTAGAILSKAFKKVVPTFESNSARVICRLRSIGGNIHQDIVSEKIIKNACAIVDPNRPGDFNEALTELGTTICTPTLAQCDLCPIRNVCMAKQMVDSGYKHSEDCKFCLPLKKRYDESDVHDYPNPINIKDMIVKQFSAACVIYRDHNNGLELYVEKQSNDGSFSNIWKFPTFHSVMSLSDLEKVNQTLNKLEAKYNNTFPDPTYLGDVTVIEKSRIYQIYGVMCFRVEGNRTLFPDPMALGSQWVIESRLGKLALPAGMRKILAFFQDLGRWDLLPQKRDNSLKKVLEETYKPMQDFDFF